MILIFGCRTKTPTGENYLRFAWWGNSERSGRTAKVAILFENANSGVKVEAEGKQLFSDDGKTLGFSDTKDTEAFFAMLLRLAKSGALLTSDDSAAAFAEEKSWCVLAWLDEVSSLQTTFGKSTVVSPLPKNPDSAENGAFLKPALFFAIPESAENPSLAAKMIDFLLNDESAAGVLSFERGVPAAKFFRNRIAENDGESVAADFVSAPVLRAEGSAEREVRRIFHEIESAVINGEISAAEGARMFVDRGTIELSK